MGAPRQLLGAPQQLMEATQQLLGALQQYAYIAAPAGSTAAVVHQWQIPPYDSRLHAVGGPPVAF